MPRRFSRTDDECHAVCAEGGACRATAVCPVAASALSWIAAAFTALRREAVPADDAEGSHGPDAEQQCRSHNIDGEVTLAGMEWHVATVHPGAECTVAGVMDAVGSADGDRTVANGGEE